MTKVFFALNKKKAREYARNVIGTRSRVRKARKQIKHISGWETYSYK